MKKRQMILPLCTSLLLLAGCATPQGMSQYKYDEVGRSTIVVFGTVITSRNVGITGKNTGAGAAIGGAVGAGAGSYVGGGSGQIWAAGAGLLVGAVAGAAAEQAAANKVGVEYVVTTEKGKTMTIVQNMNQGDYLIPKGSRVMVQTSGSYQRVLPADDLPEAIKRPKGIKMID
ncbi:MAG: hypothetical protein P8P30_01930 [Rickettsiales bacterium]|nr:hypothetical protein [Rickettsiales bacterium]